MNLHDKFSSFLFCIANHARCELILLLCNYAIFFVVENAARVFQVKKMQCFV